MILVLRRPEAFAHPTLWAEDGPIFLGQVETLGASALGTPYNGYNHLLQRLIAFAVSPLDLRWIPLAYLIGSTLVLAALVLALFSPRLPLRCRPLMALALVLVPHSGEVHNNLANLQWFGALGLLLLALVHPAQSGWQWLCDFAATILLGLTGIFSLLFAPFFLWRWWRRRDLHSGLLATVVMACAAIQVAAISQAGLLVAQPWRVTGSIIRTVALRTGGALTLPPAIAEALPTWVLVALLCGLLLLVARNLVAGQVNRPAQGIVFVAALLVVAGTLYRFRGDVFVLRLIGDGDRYFFLPKVLLLWLFVWQLPGRGFSRASAVVVCACALLTTGASWRFEPYRDLDWAGHVARLEHATEIDVPINPSGMSVRLHARPAR